MDWGLIVLTSKIIDKPGFIKVGQIVLVNDVYSLCPRSYVYLHKLHIHPTNFKIQGHNEVRMIIEGLKDMTVGSPTTFGLNKIYYNKP